MTLSDEIVKNYASSTISVYSRVPAIVLSHGSGTDVWDVAGKRYLDFSSGIAVTNLGHCHPVLNSVAQDQIARLVHTSNQFFNEPHANLARKICELSGFDRVFLSNSGAEANECALKIAKRWGNLKGGGRNEIIHFANSFHGRTLGTISATAEEKARNGFEPLLPGFIAVPPYDFAAIENSVSSNTAAIILECILARSGVVLPEKGFFRRLRELANRQGFLIILDEMQSGIGRTGTMFAFEQEDFRPDILTLAKGLANGFPIGATLCSDALAQVMSYGSHGSTFGGNPLSSRVGIEVLTLVSNPEFLNKVRDMGSYLTAGLLRLADKFPTLIAGVRGRGLMIGVHFSIPSERVLSEFAALGLLCITGGPNSIRVYPPLIVSTSEIDSALSIMEEAMCRVAEKPCE